MDSIQEGKFSLEVLIQTGPAEKVIYKGFNYYDMKDGSQFKLKLGNHSDRKTDAHIWFDRDKIGIWRINPYSEVVVSSNNFIAIRNDKQYLQKDLLRIVYLPEKYEPKIDYNNPTIMYSCNGSINRKCFNNYTDTVTPVDKLNKRCLLPACDYLKNRPLYGKGLISTFPETAQKGLGINTPLGKLNSRYKKVEPLKEVDEEMKRTVYSRIIPNKDSPSNRRKYNGIKQSKYNDKVPPLMDLRYPSRPHTCNVDSDFTFSKVYYFA